MKNPIADKMWIAHCMWLLTTSVTVSAELSELAPQGLPRPPLKAQGARAEAYRHLVPPGPRQDDYAEPWTTPVQPAPPSPPQLYDELPLHLVLHPLHQQTGALNASAP